MSTLRNGNTLKNFALALAFFLMFAESALGEDVYGPLPPPGYVERVSGWWSSVKTAVSNKLSQIRDSLSSPKSDKESELAMGREEKESASNTRTGSNYTLPNVPQVKSLALSQPARVKSILDTLGRGGNATALPIPEFTARPTRKLPEVVALPELMKLAKSERYKIPGEIEGEPELPKALKSKPPVLLTYKNNPLAPIKRMEDDVLKLVTALLDWLHARDDVALGKLHSLGLKSRIKFVREKALAFTGWILEQNGFKALAALAFSNALAHSERDETSARYDNEVLESLSMFAEKNSVAKVWMDHRTAEKIASSKHLKPVADSFITLWLAEHAYETGSYARARKLAQSVPTKTPWKEHGRYLAATSIFAQKDTRANQEAAGRELTELFRTVEDPGVFDATAVSLGRIHFILGNYKAAHKYLSQVSRNTNIFIEAAVDNSWALLRSGDRNHAVGNMFTLHTPYFEGAYMPESYFLQSLGYQEICQFGDAMTVVKQYKQRYNNAYKKVIDFNVSAKKNGADAYYDDLVAYLSKRDHKLPGIVLRELGRHPQFLRRQKVLNAIAHDEKTVSKKYPQSGRSIASWAEKPADGVRSQYAKEISKFLKSRALEIEEELKFLTANMSLLEYEIYAGAGQNLSLQGAKNFAVDGKAVPKREFEEGKEYWPYEDEIWEDELNNFRSKMVNACARVNKQS